MKLKYKIGDFRKLIDWKDGIFFLILLLYIFLIFGLMSQFKQLPSPLFGGDYFHSLGYVQHFKDGGSPFVSANFIGSLPGYFPAYTVLAGGVAKIFSLEAFRAMKVFAYIELIAALIIFYLLANYFFKDKILAIISMLLYLNLTLFPVWKYLNFALTMMFPITIFAFAYFFREQSLKSAIIVGLFFGLMGLSHSAGFVAAVIFFAVIAIYLMFFRFVRRAEKKWSFDKPAFKQSFVKTLKLVLLVGIIGAAIAMLYWFKPIFVYHGEPLNPIQEFDQMNLASFGMQIKNVKVISELYIFNFTSLFDALKSVLFILGFLAIFFIKKYDDTNKFLILALISTLLGGFHYFLTQPLIGTNLSPSYISVFAFGITVALFATLAVSVISNFAKKYELYVKLGFLILVLVLGIIQFNNYVKTDKWINVGRQELASNMAEMQKWVIGNTGVNDVFLSNNELSFALSALTGRKLVVIKRGHTDLFTNASKNTEVAALMLYSNNTQLRKQLLKERDVKYLYWDYYWIQLEYIFDQQGKFTNMFDPLALFDAPNTRAILLENNISYMAQHTWLDPAERYPEIRQFDLLFILPYQFNITHPWHPDLDNYLQEVWNYTRDGMVLSRIYKVVNV